MHTFNIALRAQGFLLLLKLTPRSEGILQSTGNRLTKWECTILKGNMCTARQCSPLRRKFMECSINNPALSLLMKHLVIGKRLKTSNCSAFHWSSRGSLVSIGQHFVATRVVHLPKSTETSLITESDQSGPNHQLLQLCTARTAWSDSDQAVLAVHSCNSWFLIIFSPKLRHVKIYFTVAEEVKLKYFIIYLKINLQCLTFSEVNNWAWLIRIFGDKSHELEQALCKPI